MIGDRRNKGKGSKGDDEHSEEYDSRARAIKEKGEEEQKERREIQIAR